MTKKLWGGRFKKSMDPLFEIFSSSYAWDCALRPHDLLIDRAHVKALLKCGVLSKAQAKKLQLAIAKLEKSSVDRNGEHAEDVHTVIQNQLKKIAGDVAEKIHTGRSRNDLVSQSSRLFVKQVAETVTELLIDIQRAILKKAQETQYVLLPGMTHLQNAQILSQAHIFLSYIEMFERAKRNFGHAKDLADVCVLGSGALAGVAYPLDQEMLARELGLKEITRNSYDVSGDREYVLALLFATASLGISFSRIAEDFMISQARGFSFIDIDESFCTGSSLMPQKKNADFIELVRGASGVLSGNLAGMMTVLKGLPTSYNRDLQWDKRFLMESCATCVDILRIFTKVFQTLKIHKEKAKVLLADESLYATDLADYLVGKGVSFKEAHGQVGSIISFAEEKKIALSKIGLDILKKFAPEVDGDVYDLFDAEHSVNMKKTIGSTHPKEVAKQIASWKRKLAA